MRVAEGVLPQVGRQLVHLRVRVERGARGVEVDEAAQPRGDLCRRHGLGERVVVARVGREESPFLFRVRSGELVSRRGSRRRRHGRGRDRQRRGRPRPSRSAPASGAPAPGHGRQPLEQPCRRGLRRELLDLPGPVRGLGLGRVDELGQQGGGAAADPARRGRGLGEGPLLAPRGQRGAAREHRDQVRPRGPGLGGDGLPSQQRRAARVSSPGSEGGDEGKHGRARARGDGAQAVVVDAGQTSPSPRRERRSCRRLLLDRLPPRRAPSAPGAGGGIPCTSWRKTPRGRARACSRRLLRSRRRGLAQTLPWCAAPPRGPRRPSTSPTWREEKGKFWSCCCCCSLRRRRRRRGPCCTGKRERKEERGSFGTGDDERGRSRAGAAALALVEEPPRSAERDRSLLLAPLGAAGLAIIALLLLLLLQVC